MSQAEIGVFGGSGFYSLLENVEEIKVDTPYGPPSDSITLASVAGRPSRFFLATAVPTPFPLTRSTTAPTCGLFVRWESGRSSVRALPARSKST